MTRRFSARLWLLCATLVTSATASAQTSLRTWRVSETPLISIGGDGAPQSEFFRIRTAWRLSDGGVVVADGSTRELRVFTARGAFASTLGRKGAGPGEFDGMQWSSHFGDTAVVFDGNLRRITTVVLSGAPRVIKELAVRGDDQRGFDIAGRLRDGRWLAHSLGMPNMQLPLGVQRLKGSAGLLAADALGAVTWLPEQPDLAVLVHSPDANQKQVSVVVAPFAASLAVATTGNVIWMGDTGTDSLARVDPRTSQRTTVRLPDPPVALRTRVVDAARAREMASARSQAAREGIARKYTVTYLPKYQPVFEALIPGHGDELWVQRFVDDASAPAQYVVVAGGGTLLARVSVAPGFRVTDVGRDYVVGIHTDRDGVETVRVYALTR